MQRSLESSERIGFAQDILQNLTKYRDFDYYKSPIVEYNYLDVNLPKDEVEELVLMNSFGFPEENGLVYVSNPEVDNCSQMKLGEVVLYRKRVGNTLVGLERGASATLDLGSFVRDSIYESTEATNHTKGTKVYNLSALFLTSMLETIHSTYADGVEAKWIYPEINHGTLLERFRDFFQAKGTKLGIKALFKFIFGENDVEVSYPGDRMIEASTSTWQESFIVRSVPMPQLLVAPYDNYILPDRLINREVTLKSWNDQLNKETASIVYGRAICDYVSSYEYNDQTQYEFYIQKNQVEGNFNANPFTQLTRSIYTFGTGNDDIDVTTITVETTLGFPEKGVIFIGDEGIYYEEKTFNQFLRCKRGFVNVETNHNRGDRVYGPYYLEGIETITDDYGKTTELTSKSWPLGLVASVEVDDPGLLHLETDEIYPNGPGRIDPREPIMGSFIENYNDSLMKQNAVMPYMADHTNRTAGVSGVYFDDDFVFVTSSNFPNYPIGNFSKDYSVGPTMQAINAVHVIPRRENIKENYIKTENGKREYYFHDKGTREIGTFIDGVPAYSNVSPNRLIQGRITEYRIINAGYGYITPTLLVNEQPVPETITLDSTNQGQILHITADDPRNYDQIPPLPTVRVTGGEGGEIAIEFDRYGRAITATITNPGLYYNDVPSLALVDTSRRGKGGAISCTVENGQLQSVTILNTGIDYNPNTTKCVITSKGVGAEIFPFVQYYQFDRYAEVKNNPYWQFDSGMGFLWENFDNGDKQFFGYISTPTRMIDGIEGLAYLNTEKKERIKTHDGVDYIIISAQGGTTGAVHSPLLGYAYDGNPIYGPNLYNNGTDSTDGYRYMYSGWTLRQSRSDVIPSGGDSVATLPPSEQLYPMGTFVEDYFYNPAGATRTVRILSEEYEKILTTEGDYIAASAPIPDEWILNENNAIKVNTPEYPAELYPDGVWVYVCTERAGEPAFPYIVGTTFENRPVSQNISLVDSTDPRPGKFIIYNPESVYREFPIEFNYDKVDRFRNDYLTPTKDEVVLEIANTSTGGVSEIVVVDGQPVTSKVGDFMYFDNEDTSGSGALGIVTDVDGEDVIAGEGSDILTQTISHYQRLNLRGGDAPELDADGYPLNYLFVKGSIITTSSLAEAIVIDYDPFNLILDVYTYTKQLVQPGDTFRDERGDLVTLGTVDPAQEEALSNLYELTSEQQDDLFLQNNDNFRARNVFVANGEPNADGNQAGDLWFSVTTGKLYIFFNDGDSSQWVVTQPIGMRPLVGASDTPIGTTKLAVDAVSSPQEENKVTISTTAPSARTDGSPNKEGDLWWSNHTGIMYIWSSTEWVCTDPNATIPIDTPANQTNWDLGTLDVPTEPYECKQTVLISYTAPEQGLDGALIEDGFLWWSPLTGKMYIRYTYFGVSSWVITNPVGILSSAWAIDYIPEGDGGSIPPPVTPLPIVPPGDIEGEINKLNKGEVLIWFEHLENFDPGDKLLFLMGAPGTGATHTATLLRILEPGTPTCAVVRRDNENFNVPDGTVVQNISKSLYTVYTERPHKIRTGDVVTISGSAYDDVNGDHVVSKGGTVKRAEGSVQVIDQKITNVTVTDGGLGYTENFYITFYGGGGVGAYAYVEVNQNTQSVDKVTVLDGGDNYSSEPQINWSRGGLPDTSFEFYTPVTYPMEEGLTYITSSVNAESSIAKCKVISPGVGYKKLPIVVGPYKKEIDRGEFQVNLNGTNISTVDILKPGARYISPIAIFYDIQGTGRGASAKVDVVEGKVEKITMIDGGEGYTEPAMLLVENKGKFIALTDDIGQIESIKVLNPGRAISPDRSLKPEIMIETKCIVEFETVELASLVALNGFPNFALFGLDGYSPNTVLDASRETNAYDTMQPGDMVWQGTEDGSYKQVTAEFVSYDSATQVITLREVKGILKPDEYLYNEDGVKGLVRREGQADTACVIRGISKPQGKFVDDTSIVSSSYAHLQDSYYYQKFSYSISSPLQQHQFDDFVQGIIHPAGFIMFSDLAVTQEFSPTINLMDPIIQGPVEAILSPDAYDRMYTAISTGQTQFENPAISPNTGTIEL